MDPECAERVEAELDAMIERRTREARDANRVEEAWKESERAHREKRRRENRKAWVFYERHLEHVHMGLALEHRARADALGNGSPEAT